MNERMQESLSALMDGQADELEIRRLLKESEHNPNVFASWHSYQLIGAVMRGESVSSVDLSKGIRQALDGEPMDDLQGVKMTGKTSARWPWLAASGAVAASVMLAVLVGVQWQQQQLAPAALVATNATPIANDTVSTLAPALATAQVSAAPAELSAAQQQELEQAQQKLKEYVLEHNATLDDSQQSLPFARTVKFNQE